jgi:hypothetical protein
MPRKTIETITPAAPGIDTIDEALAALEVEEILEGADEALDAADTEIDDTEIEEIEASAEDVTIEEGSLLDAALKDIETGELKAKSYAEQESEISVEVEAPKAKATKPAKVKEPTPAKPRAARTLDALPDEAFILVADDVTRDMATVRSDTLAARPSAKKIGEKFDNLLLQLHAGKLPSVYTVICFKALKAKGEVTSADFIAALSMSTLKSGTKEGYNIGTQRAQAQQMMTLFPALRIATKSGGKLTLNPDSVIADALSALIDGPATGEATEEVVEAA